MNRKNITITVAVGLCAATLALGGCKEEGAGEKAGKAADKAVEKAGEATGDALEKSGEAVKDATK
jgi:hypothetical protein